MSTKTNQISLSRAWGYAALICMGGILYGIDQGGLSGFFAMPAFNRQFGTYNPKTKAYAVNATDQLKLNMVCLAGAVLAALSGGELTGRFGRKAGMFALSTAGILGAAVQLGATTLGALLAGKFFVGAAFGYGSMVTSLFLSETAPRTLRASMISMLLLCFALGSMIGAGVNWATHKLDSHWAYRGPFVAELVPPFLVLLGLLILPESPRWLIQKGQKDKAANSIRRLRGRKYSEEAVQDEVDAIEVAVEEERRIAEAGASWAQLFQGTNRRRTSIAILVFVFQQYSGISFVTAYGTYFFSVSGIKNSFLIGFLLQILSAAGCITAMLLTRYVGRRPMMLIGGVSQCLCMFIFAAVGVAAPGTNAAAKCLAAFVLLYEYFTHASWIPLAYTIASEVPSQELRAKTVALAVGVNWTCTMTIAGWLPYALNPSYGNLGAKLGFIFGPFIAIGTVWMYFYLPETANKTLEQLDEIFVKRIPARKTASYQYASTSSRQEEEDTMMSESKMKSQEIETESV